MADSGVPVRTQDSAVWSIVLMPARDWVVHGICLHLLLIIEAIPEIRGASVKFGVQFEKCGKLLHSKSRYIFRPDSVKFRYPKVWYHLSEKNVNSRK
jgi:hypothetical protein